MTGPDRTAWCAWTALFEREDWTPTSKRPSQRACYTSARKFTKAAVSKWNIWALTNLPPSGSVPPEHLLVETSAGWVDAPLVVQHDHVRVVNRDHPGIHLSFSVGRLERVPCLLPAQAGGRDLLAPPECAAVRERRWPDEFDVGVVEGEQSFEVAFLDGTERLEYDLGVLGFSVAVNHVGHRSS